MCEKLIKLDEPRCGAAVNSGTDSPAGLGADRITYRPNSLLWNRDLKRGLLPKLTDTLAEISKLRKGLKMNRFKVFSASIGALAIGLMAPATALAQDEVGVAPTPDVSISAPLGGGEITPFDANVRNGWVKMFLRGGPGGWNVSLSNDIPGGGGLGHYEITGPNGYHWNSPEYVNPSAYATGTGAGWVCGELWIKQGNGSYQSAGKPCAQVY